MLRKIAEYLGSNKTLCEGDTLTVYHKDQIIVDQMEIEKSFILETVDIYDVENELDIKTGLAVVMGEKDGDY